MITEDKEGDWFAQKITRILSIRPYAFAFAFVEQNIVAQKDNDGQYACAVTLAMAPLPHFFSSLL
jgi:hypothetical protein